MHFQENTIDDLVFIIGSDDSDRLIGTNNNDVIESLEGDDTLEGRDGNDELNGGLGNNTLYGGSGNDTLINNFGYVDGSSGSDILRADYSTYETAIQNFDSRSYVERVDNDVDLLTLSSVEFYHLTGTNYNDSLQGNSYGDTLIGGAGNDEIRGGFRDVLDGGEGTDKLRLDLSDVTETITIDFTSIDNQITLESTEIRNFEAIDYIYLGSNANSVTLSLDAATSGGEIYGYNSEKDTVIADYSGYETAVQNFDSRSYIERVDNDVDLMTLSGVEFYHLTGTDYDDSLQGNSYGDTLIGGSGDDEIRGGSGNDTLIGVNPDLDDAGVGELDYLQGGSGNDLFILGDDKSIFYNDQTSFSFGSNDYALIEDFEISEDIIQLSGTKNEYRLGYSPISNVEGTAIYWIDREEQSRELIAIIKDITGLTLDSDNFTNIEREEPIIVTPEVEEEPVIVTPSNEPEVQEEPVIVTPPIEPEAEEEPVVMDFDSYEIMMISTGLNTESTNLLTTDQSNFLDINQDGYISALDAYLAYSSVDDM